VCLEEDFARAAAVGPRFAGVSRGGRRGGRFLGRGRRRDVVGARAARRGFGEARARW
jgi:hypothetical protein